MVEVFRRRVIKLQVDRKLLNQDFAGNLLCWKYSGFSQDAGRAAMRSIATMLIKIGRSPPQVFAEQNTLRCPI
jgi:hypothetical protein